MHIRSMQAHLHYEKLIRSGPGKSGENQDMFNPSFAHAIFLGDIPQD